LGFWLDFVHLHDTIIMGSIVLNGTTVTDYNAGVTVNGVAIQEVYFNGTKYWTRHPYPIGTDVFTYTWGPGYNIDDFRTSYYSAYPLVFSSQPYYTQGGGSPDSRLVFNVKPGFTAVNYHNDERGDYANPWGGASGQGLIGVYHTFTAFEGPGFGLAGNGLSYFTIRYVGN